MDILIGSVYSMLTLKMRHISAVRVPHHLTHKQLQKLINVYRSWKQILREFSLFLNRVITVDETWFLLSFRNFSKSNVFSENLMRMKFILHKIFFQMSILSSSATSWMFFNLHWKNCEKPFAGEHNHFEEKGASGDKNQYNLFCRKWGFDYFSFKNFFEKNNIFQHNWENIFFFGGGGEGEWPFFRERGVRRQKWI